MIQRVAKGKRYEREARKVLEEDGYLTDFKVSSRYASDDIFEYFDVIAIKEDNIKLIQVKTNKSGFYTARREIAEWILENGLKDNPVSFEVWLRLPREPWRKEKINKFKKD